MQSSTPVANCELAKMRLFSLFLFSLGCRIFHLVAGDCYRSVQPECSPNCAVVSLWQRRINKLSDCLPPLSLCPSPKPPSLCSVAAICIGSACIAHLVIFCPTNIITELDQLRALIHSYPVQMYCVGTVCIAG